MRLERRTWLLWGGPAAVAIGVGAWLAVSAGLRGSDPEPRPNLTVLVDQFRNDEPRHRVRLTFTNHESQPVTVASVQLLSPDFAELPPTPHDYKLPPGGTIGVGLPAEYGDGICNDGIPSAARPAQAVATISYPDGGQATFTWPLPDRRKLLDLLLRQDCERQKIASTLELGLVGPWTQTQTADGDPAMHATLRMRLVDPAATVEVTQVRGSVLYHLKTPPLRLDGTHQELSVPAEFTNNRCDEHAVSGSTQSFVFRMWLSIDGAEPIAAVIPGMDDAAKEELTTLIRVGCGFG
ncbi:MAG: cytochrome c-type biogenesis protein CcmH [Sporichthyaceae bacterium]|nr:cytochrome c-type biogenesis protein CcmH [Sporichthyaceae bacterium]